MFLMCALKVNAAEQKLWQSLNSVLMRDKNSSVPDSQHISAEKNRTNSPGSPAVAAARIAPEICQGQPPTTYSGCSGFHPNRFAFDGVTAERVNGVITAMQNAP